MNGWKNRETWNVALWINNDESLYNIALSCNDYPQFADILHSMGEKTTFDGYNYGDCLNGYGNLDLDELNELIKELK